MTIKNYLRYFGLTTLLFLIGIGVAPPATAQEQPPVLAFYYAWFDQNTWTSGQSVDLPAEPYLSADRVTIERHVAQAQGAGINAFIQSWYGPQETNNQTETNFRMLLDVAASSGFQAAVDFETVGPFFADAASVTNALNILRSTHMQHPAYLRYQGKPVVFFWRQQRFSIDEWSAIRQQVDPNRETYWIAEGVDISYQSIFDGHHLYSVAWAALPADQLAKWGNRVRNYEAENQVDRLWVATAMPGYDDTRLPRADAFAVSRRAGDYYRETWRGAVASQPDMIIITSFNEWPEGTHIEPSASYGNLYLDVTRELVTELRGSAPAEVSIQTAQTVQTQEAAQPETEQLVQPAAAVAPVAESQPEETDDVVVTEDQTEPQTELAAQTPDEPYIQAENIINVRSGPSTDFERIGRLGVGDTSAVLGQNEAGDWLLIEFLPVEEGRGWVALEVIDFFGDQATIPVVDDLASLNELEAEIVFPTADIPAGGINVRSGPGLDFDLLGRLTEGETVTLIGQNETAEWWQIEFADSEDGVGWITAALLEVSEDTSQVPVVSTTREDDVFPTVSPTPQPPVFAGQIAANGAVNVRAEPSTESAIVGGLYLDETAKVLSISEDGQWWQIEFAAGPEGLAWITTEFVRFQGDETLVPIFGLGTATPTPGPTDTPTPTTAAAEATPTATPGDLEFPATFAPTATSEFAVTSAAIIETRGTPDPSLTDTSDGGFLPDWQALPWGILALVVVIGFIAFQLMRQRK